MTSKLIEGGCFCGAVRYGVAAKPIASMLCHCESCRRIAGAPVVAWITFPKEQFRITHGQLAELASSAGVRRTHCAKCGTSITYETAKAPAEIDVTTCTLDEPAAFPPTHHSWLADDLPWVRFGDGLPSYPTSKHSA